MPEPSNVVRESLHKSGIGVLGFGALTFPLDQRCTKNGLLRQMSSKWEWKFLIADLPLLYSQLCRLGSLEEKAR
jgi:hypothetical protein